MMKNALSILLPLILVCSSQAQQIIKAQSPKWELPVPEERLTEAELVQQTISMHLTQSDAEQAKHLRQNMDIVIGDVRRVVGLPKDRLRLLEIAAKGAVDRNMEGWRTAQENQVRQQAQGLTATIVRQRLEAVGTMTVGNEAPDESALWKEALTSALTPEERSKWAEAEEGRNAYRLQAVAKLLVAELDRQLGLTLTQCQKLEPMTTQAVHDYLPDMGSYIDRGNGIDFRMLLLLLNAVPQADTQAILTPTQYTKWNQVIADYRGWWQSVDQTHRTRIQNGGAMPPSRKGTGMIIRGGRMPFLNGNGAIRGPIIINGNGGNIILKK